MQTKKLTLSAILAALAVAFLNFASLIEFLDLTAVFLASLLVAFAVIELGHPWHWLVYAVSGILALLVVPNKFAPVEYALLVGSLPILKLYIERLPRPLAALLKLLVFNLLFTGCLLLSCFVMGFPIVGETLFGIYFPAGAIWALLYVMGNIAGLAYDFLLTRLAYLYDLRFRERVERWLKR